MISVSDSKHDCQILPKVDLTWRSSCHVFPLFFFMLNVTWHHLQSCFVRKTAINLQSFFCCFLQVQYFEMKNFKSISSDCDHIVLNLEEATAQECPKKNNWSSSCTRMSQEKQLKQQLHKNVPRKTIEAAAAQECLRKQSKQQLHKNV